MFSAVPPVPELKRPSNQAHRHSYETNRIRSTRNLAFWTSRAELMCQRLFSLSFAAIYGLE
jgi:hypothetical protein